MERKEYELDHDIKLRHFIEYPPDAVDEWNSDIMIFNVSLFYDVRSEWSVAVSLALNDALKVPQKVSDKMNLIEINGFRRKFSINGFKIFFT